MAFLQAYEKTHFLKDAIKRIADGSRPAFTGVLDIILPPKCLKCGCRIDQAHNICPDCWKQIHFISSPMCQSCGYPFEFEMSGDFNTRDKNLCAACHQQARKFDKCISVLRYDDHSKNMIIGFKHQDRLEYAHYFAKLLKRAGAVFFKDVAMIIPVPLHEKRLFKRRYNQSALLSTILTKSLQGDGIKIDHQPQLLCRIKNTPPQQGNIKKRSQNVRGVFEIDKSRKALIKDKNILLLDDVYTTGATAENCAKTLKKAGANKVFVLTLYRAVSA